MPEEPRPVRLYRWLLRCYPAAFQEEYAREMERAFRDEIAESGGATLRIWLRLLLDLAISLPMQFASEAVQDLGHAMRMWAMRPLQTAFAIVALAIGIGANVGVFSVVNALLLRSLPFRDPGRLVAAYVFLPPHATAKDFHEWRAKSAYLSDAALVDEADVNLGSGRRGQRAHIAHASSNYFSFFGAPVLLGRGFEAGEDATNHPSVAILGYGLWQSLFAGDERVLGSQIRVNDQTLTIVGVAPKGFSYPHNAVLWMPAAYTPGDNGWQVLGRLRPGVSLTQADQALKIEADRLNPNRTPQNKARYPTYLTSLQDSLAGPVRNASLLLMASVALILLLACANVANLLMARTADRFGELSIRSALGASRGRITQQLLTESLALSGLASIAGFGVALEAVVLAEKVQPSPLPSQAYSILDMRVLLFAIAVSLATGLLFGVLPSFYARRAVTLQARGASVSRTSRWIREGLVAVQVMLSILLLASSVAIGRQFIGLMRMDRGYDTQHVATVSVSLEGTTRKNAPLVYFEQVLERIRAIPGVRSATATDFLPLDATMFLGGPFGLDGRPARENSMVVPVQPDYFETMGGRILAGREITREEVRADAKVAVVNERFASNFGAPADVLNHSITIGRAAPRKVIGVVKDMDYDAGIYDANSFEIFVPGHNPGGFYPTFAIRADSNAQQYAAKLRDVVASVDSQVVVFGAKTMEQRLAQTLVRPRFFSTGAVSFAVFAVLLAVIGIYGLVSYAVAQSSRELGIRMALGTTPLHLRGSVLGHGLIPVVLGSLPGIMGAMLASRYLGSLIAGTKPVDLPISALAIGFVILVAATSIWIASRKISRLDVMEILRAE
jgi:putative ABC transport system permease protein